MERTFRASGVVASGVVAWGTAAVVAALLLPAGTAEAGVTCLNSFRRVEAKAEIAGPMDVTTDTGFGPFAGTALSEYRTTAGEQMRARVTQSSATGDDFVRASGDAAARSELYPPGTPPFCRSGSR